MTRFAGHRRREVGEAWGRRMTAAVDSAKTRIPGGAGSAGDDCDDGAEWARQ